MRNTYTDKGTSKVTRIFFAFFGMFSTSISKILHDAQISEYNKKFFKTSNATYDISQYNINPTSTVPPHLHHL